jgi:hypothetical protein
MSATNRRFYKITIKLTTNDIAEKEFTIENMGQILLDNFAEKDSPNNDYNKLLYMLGETYYINNDVLQKIRELSKVQNKNYKFLDFLRLTSPQIENMFYSKIFAYNNNEENKKLVYDTMQYIIRVVKRYFDKYDTRVIDQDTYKKNFFSRYNIDYPTLKRNINAFSEAVSNNKEYNFADEIPSEIMSDILCDKDVMSKIRSAYEDVNSEDAIKFKNNLNTIMTKISADNTNKLKDLEKYEYFLDKINIEYIFDTIHTKMTDPINSQEQSYGYYGRSSSSLINTSENRKKIISDNLKYVYPNKTNVELLDDNEENNVILFNNVLYIVKKIYLLDTTIIKADDDKDISKLFYIKNLTLEKNNPFKISTYTESTSKGSEDKV